MKGEFVRIQWASEQTGLSENALTRMAVKRGWEVPNIEGTVLIDARVANLRLVPGLDPEPQPKPEPDFGADGWPNWIA